MKIKVLRVSNTESKGRLLLGVTGYLSYEGEKAVIHYGDYPNNGMLITSKLRHVQQSDDSDIIELHTKNTVYTLQELEDE